MRQLIFGVVVGLIVGSGATLGVQEIRASNRETAISNLQALVPDPREPMALYIQLTELTKRVAELERLSDIIWKERMQAAVNEGYAAEKAAAAKDGQPPAQGAAKP